jgi:hypothetical protein
MVGRLDGTRSVFPYRDRSRGMDRTELLVAVVVGVVVFGTAGATASGTAIRQVSASDGAGADAVSVDETIRVAGVTNLRPDENVIVVEVRNEALEVVAVASTDGWGYDGRWNVTVDLTGLPTGTYTVIADDGHGTDRETIQVVGATATPTPESTATSTPEPTATSTPESTATPTPESTVTSTETRTPSPVPTRSDGRGLGAVVAALSIAVAVAVLRRR